MSERSSVHTCARAAAIVVALLAPAGAGAATLSVPAGGNLQSALDAAEPGDTILLAPGATFVGNFVLPVHGGTTYVTIRTAGNDALLPGPGERITPAHAPYLAKLRSPNSVASLRTAARAAYWRVMLLEFLPNENGAGDIMQLGSPSAAQNTLDVVPHHLIVDRIYMHGDPLIGQKRGIHLNSRDTSIVNSHIDEIKAIGQDTQAIGGANGPGPYQIENNRLEAGGEVFIIGGDDPKIPGLVPADLLFRGNTLTRPVSWRSAIVPTPAGVSATAGTGGSLAAGTYSYRVVARRPAGTATATSAPSAEASATVGASGRVTVRWNGVPNATSYRVYGRMPGGQTMYWTVTGTSFTDAGSMGAAGTPPSRGTVWQVKNLFELKNMRRAQIDYNVMENNWLQAQSGVAVLFTVRNQYGGCPQCVVEDVTFEHNIVRNVGAGITILGIDNNYPSQQTNNIRIRHNEFSGIDRTWGGNGYFLMMTDNPRDITIDHNTIISPNGLGVVTVSGPPVYGFVFTNNVARHNSYGIFGGGLSYGNTAIAHYFPGAVIRRNVLAGGKASVYPADNLFPSTADFAAHFVDYAGGDYALRPGTDWAGAGTDALDLGADIAHLRTARDGSSVEPLEVVTESLPPTTELEPYSATLEAAGGLAPFEWTVLDGTLPPGISLDPLTGLLSGAAAMAGDFVFTVRVADAEGNAASQPLMLHADRAIRPVEILTTAVAGAVASVPYAQQLEAAGGLGSYVWRLAGGQLPSGVTLSATGLVSGTPASTGTWSFTATAEDAQDAMRAASRTFALTVAAVLNRPPAVSLLASVAGVVPVGATVAITADATDVDGVVRRVDFFVDGEQRSVTEPPFTLAWVARDGGPHAISATAVDDDGAAATSAVLSIATTPEIVIYASDVQRLAGDFQLVADSTAAHGQRLWNPNRNAAKILSAAATPGTFAEFTFYAEAGRPYRLWIRGRGERNLWPNDSAFLQFSGAADAAGASVGRIGTAQSMWYSVEEYSNAGLLNWGWQDNGFGSNVMGPALYFARTGEQTIRIQPREDGISMDQIVISPARNLTAAPGLPKSDATIVMRP